jgi:hypothetical protein
MLRRSLLNEVGLFDQELPACEDYDLWLRISCLHPIYLVEEPLVFKEGGASDQLSARYKGMDRFRIKAMAKLIKGNKLDESQLGEVFRELSLKCRIYGNGCLKRGKKEEGGFYLSLPGRLQKGEKIDFQAVSLDSQSSKKNRLFPHKTDRFRGVYKYELNSLHSQLECWNIGGLECWVLGNCGNGLLRRSC